MSEVAQMPKGVQKVTLMTAGEPVVLYDRTKKSKRRSSGVLRPLERALRTSLCAQKLAAEDFLDSMGKSNGKKKNGWVRDFTRNFRKAARKGLRMLKRKML